MPEVKEAIDRMSPDERVETMWLTQKQMSVLFGCSSENVIVHLKRIYRDEEFVEEATSKGNLAVQAEGGRTVSRKIRFYNLDAIISVGFRGNTKLGIRFRQWANGVVQSHLLKGYSINERLNTLEDRVGRRMAKTERDVVEVEGEGRFLRADEGAAAGVGFPPVEVLGCEVAFDQVRPKGEARIGRRRRLPRRGCA